MSSTTRVVLYWLMVLLLFIAVNATVNGLMRHQGPSTKTHKSLNLTTAMTIKPGRYYQTNGVYHLDMTGTTRLTLPIKTIPENPQRYDTVVIKGLDLDPQINLYWQWQTDQSEPLKYQLSGYQRSVNVLPDDWQHSDAISQLNLIVETDITLGFTNNYNSELSWQSIELMHHSDISAWQRFSSAANAFTPLDFMSLNSFSSNNELNYRQLLIRIGFWLILVIGLYLIIRPAAIHILLALIVAWSLVTLVYGYNFSRQITSHSSRYQEKPYLLNEIDQRLKAVAEKINQAIDGDSKQAESAKLFIIGNKKFQKDRLNYYLLNHNTGNVNTLSSLLNQDNHDNSYAVFLPPHLDVCSNESDAVPDHEPDQKSDWPLKPTVKRLISESDFCLVRL